MHSMVQSSLTCFSQGTTSSRVRATRSLASWRGEWSPEPVSVPTLLVTPAEDLSVVLHQPEALPALEGVEGTAMYGCPSTFIGSFLVC